MKRILIVEDNLAIDTMLTYALRKKGFEVISESRLLDAFERVYAHTFDLILLDLNLPDGNGLELLTYLRLEAHLSTPVIILSAVKQQVSIAEALSWGACEFVTKPFSVVALMQQIEAWLLANVAS